MTISSQDGDKGTNAQVTMTVYGDAGNSGPLSLGQPGKGFFKAGATDCFNASILFVKLSFFFLFLVFLLSTLVTLMSTCSITTSTDEIEFYCNLLLMH